MLARVERGTLTVGGFEMQTGAASAEISVENSQKPKKKPKSDPAVALLGMCLKQSASCFIVRCCSIHSSKEMETPYMSFNRQTGDDDVVLYTLE